MDEGRQFEGGSAPAGWVHLYDLHAFGRDAQWVLVNGYAELAHGQPRHVLLSDQPGDLGFGTLIRVTLPLELVRRHMLRDGYALPGTYQVPAEIINRHGKMWVARVGHDHSAAASHEAPLESALREVLDDATADWWDAAYEAGRRDTASYDREFAPPPMHIRLVLLAYRQRLIAAIDEAMPTAAWREAEYRLDEADFEPSDGTVDDEGADDEFDGATSEERIDWKAYHRRARFESALAISADPVNPAAWGVALQALSTIENPSPATLRLVLFVRWFSQALTVPRRAVAI